MRLHGLVGKSQIKGDLLKERLAARIDDGLFSLLLGSHRTISIEF